MQNILQNQLTKGEWVQICVTLLSIAIGLALYGMSRMDDSDLNSQMAEIDKSDSVDSKKLFESATAAEKLGIRV